MIEQEFIKFCNELNGCFHDLALLIEHRKSDSEDIQQILKDTENGG